jgi:hypothetical protein
VTVVPVPHRISSTRGLAALLGGRFHHDFR